jgi:hypothetical protein
VKEEGGNKREWKEWEGKDVRCVLWDSVDVHISPGIWRQQLWAAISVRFTSAEGT